MVTLARNGKSIEEREEESETEEAHEEGGGEAEPAHETSGNGDFPNAEKKHPGAARQEEEQDGGAPVREREQHFPNREKEPDEEERGDRTVGRDSRNQGTPEPRGDGPENRPSDKAAYHLSSILAAACSASR